MLITLTPSKTKSTHDDYFIKNSIIKSSLPGTAKMQTPVAEAPALAGEFPKPHADRLVASAFGLITIGLRRKPDAPLSDPNEFGFGIGVPPDHNPVKGCLLSPQYEEIAGWMRDENSFARLLKVRPRR